MAYQMLEYTSQPGIRQGDELVCFTQSVINMEKEISQITKERKTKISDDHNVQRTFPECISHTPEWRRIGMDGGNIYSGLIESRRVQDGNTVEIVRLSEDSRQERQGFTSRQPDFESAAEGILQHTYGPRRHISESRDGIIWTPSQTPQTYNSFKSPGCDITLSRVYFAQGEERNDHVPVNGYNCTSHAEEEVELPQELEDREKNSVQDKIIAPPRRQSAPSSLVSSVAKPSPLFGGRFQNSQPTKGKHTRRAGKRFSSEAEEYVYFLPEYQEPRRKRLSLDNALCSKSYSISTDYSSTEKRSKTDQEVPEMVVTPDDNEVVRTRQCRNLVQVVTDNEGRIRVNVTATPAPERQQIQGTQPIIAHEGHSTLRKFHRDLERTTTEQSNSKGSLEINECSAEAIHFENQTPETCYHTSALITNDHRWDAWKRANCIPRNEFDTETSFNHYTKHDYYRTVQLCGRERQTIGFRDENNNNISGVETPHLNKFIQTSSHNVPDNSELSHAKAAKHNFVQSCEQTTQKEKHTERLSNIPTENCSRNYQSLLKNNQRCACIDRQTARCQKTQTNRHNEYAKGTALVGVSDSRTTFRHNFRNNSNQVLKEDTRCRLRQERTEQNRKDLQSTILPANRDDVQTSCSEPGMSKASCITISSNSLQSTTEKKNSVNGFRKEIETGKISNQYKETLTKTSSIENGGRYRCDWPACEKIFRHYSFLVLHKRIHTGERPYVCSWEGCPKQFRRSDDYQRHYRVHTGAKPYICIFCGKGFKRSDHRLFHYRAIHHMTKDAEKEKRKRKNMNEIRQDTSSNK